MATFTRPDDLQGAEFVDVSLEGAQFVDTNLQKARFRRADLSGVVMRAVEVQNADIDAPGLSGDGSFLRINGVDVIPLVEAELNRRFPGRAGRHATDPDGLRSAWAALEWAWAATLDRVAAMPPGTVDVSVGGEWSFAQTLRHLVMATDAWLGRAVLGIEQPFHPIGEPNAEYETDGNDMSVFATATPSYADVLEVRAAHVAMVRDFLATVTPEDLAATRKHTWAPEYPVTVLYCLHVILREEWEHLRYAVRDLDVFDATSDHGLSPHVGSVEDTDGHDPVIDMTLRYEIFPQDLDAIVDFYARVLGFSVTKDERGDPEAYVALNRGAVHIGALRREGPTAPAERRPPIGVELVLEVDDIAAERDRVVAAGWPLEEDLQDRPWDLTDFRILDPAGYYLRITGRAQ